MIPRIEDGSSKNINLVRLSRNRASTSQNRARTSENRARISENRARPGENRARPGENRARTGENRARPDKNRASTNQSRVRPTTPNTVGFLRQQKTFPFPNQFIKKSVQSTGRFLIRLVESFKAIEMFAPIGVVEVGNGYAC